MALVPKQLGAGEQISDSAATIYTATNGAAIIKKVPLSNTTGSSRTVDMHIVAAGGSAAVTNQILEAYAVAANTTASPDVMVNQIIPKGAFLQALASAASAITVIISGVENQ